MRPTTTRTDDAEEARRFSSTSTSEAAILDRIVRPDEPTFSPEAAECILALDFEPDEKDRMHQLSAKAGEGTLTPEEQAAANNYERVGHLLNILQSKARRSLKASRGANGTAKAR